MSKWRVPVCWWTALLLGAVISLSIYAQQDQDKSPKSTSVQEAIRLYEQARFLEAREAAQNALKSELPLKEQIALRELLAFVAVATDEHHLAQSYFVEILKHNPDYKPVKESPKIQRVFEAARLRLRLEQARDAYRKGDLENLGSFAKAALQAELTPAEQVEALWYVAYYQVALGDEQGATRTFKEILKLKPDFKVSPDASPKLHRLVQTVTTPVLSGKKGGGGGAGAAIGALAALGGLAAALGKGGGKGGGEGGGGGAPLPPTGTIAGYVYQGSLFIVPSASDAPFPSQPAANAEVWLESRYMTYTDSTGYFSLTAYVGTYELIVRAGGETLRQTIVVHEGYQVLGPINVPPSGTLNINSSPSGARIFIDGIYTRKVTPATLKVITGSHQVILTNSGYKDEIFNILVSSGSTQTVNKTLQPITTNRPPNKPANQQPANGAVINTLTPTLQSSSFSDPDGDSHKASQWRIREQDSTSYVWDSGEDRTNKISIAVPSGRLQWGKTYLWQVRYQDEYGAWSEWSDETSFHTNRDPNKPSNEQPANGAVINTLTPTLRASSFSDPDGDNHRASQWRIREQDSTSYVWDSGEDATNKTSITVPNEVLEWGRTYLWQVRYQDEHGAWSEWSDETSFHTNRAPNKASNPNPANGALNVPIGVGSIELMWDSSDPDMDDLVTFDIYFGETSPPSLIAKDWSETIFRVWLERGKTYYWKVVVKDSHGFQTEGDIWMFTTENFSPEKPANQQPANGAAINTLTPTLQSSSFSDPDGDNHHASQWRIREQGSTSYVWDSGEDATNKTSITVPNGVLEWGRTYLWQVRYQDEYGAWSEWSDETSFHTNRDPNKPSNEQPANGAVINTLTPTLRASSFSDPDGDSHKASQWRIREQDSTSYVWDSGEDRTNKISIAVPSGRLQWGKTYLWQVRYQDEYGAWSEWSDETKFITDNMPPTITLAQPQIGSFWNSPIPISGAASDPLAHVQSVKISYSTDGTTWTDIATLVNSADEEPFNFQTAWTPPAEGSYILRLEVTDRVGNTALFGQVEAVGDWLRSWLLLGTFDGYFGDNPIGSDEGAMTPIEGSQNGGKVWSKYISTDDWINLGNVYGEPWYEISYAHIYIFSPIEQEAILTGTVDDDIRIWVNGTEIYAENNWGMSDFTTPKFTLLRGWNRILLKVWNHGGGWGFKIGVRDASGNPISGLMDAVNGYSLVYDVTSPQLEIASPTQALPAYVQRGDNLIVRWKYTDFSPCSATIEVKKNGILIGKTDLTNLPAGTAVERTDQVPIKADAETGFYDLSISVTDAANNSAMVSQPSAVYVTIGSHHSGEITVNETWTLATHPHYVDADVVVKPGVTLTIEPGVEVRFAGGTRLKIEGKLVADSSSGRQIVFNGDPAANPGAGFWKDIYFTTGSQGILRNCLIKHSGQDGRALLCQGAQVEVNRCIFTEQGGECIRIQDGANVELKDSTLVSPGTGDWSGIVAVPNAAIVKIDGCLIVSTSGRATIAMANNCQVILRNSRIKGNLLHMENYARLIASDVEIEVPSYLASIDLTCNAIVYNIRATGAGKAILVRDGVTGAYTRWTLWTADGWYELEGNVTVRKGGVLRLESSPEAPLRIVSRGGGIYVGGRLEALGSQNNPIVFTASEQSPGKWAGIYFRSGSGPSILRNCRIEFAGSTTWGPSNRKSALFAENADVMMEYCTVTKSAGYGIVIYGGTPMLKNLTVADCASVGVSLESNTSAEIRNSVFAFNTGYGIDNTSSGNPVITYCDTFGNQPANYRDPTGQEQSVPPGDGNISQDPQFVNRTGMDYHLQSGSPCINAGHPDDRDPGTNSRADMGAYPSDTGTGGATMVITAVPDIIPPDGVSQSTITVKVMDASGNPLRGQTVEFATTSGTLSATTATTDDNGIASVTLTSTTTPQIATVTVSLPSSRLRSMAVVSPPSGQVKVEFGGVGVLPSDGWIKEWLVCGYWSGDINTKPIDDESSISPNAGELMDEREWIKAQVNQDNNLDLDSLFGGPDYCVAYAHIYIGSQVTQTVRLSGTNAPNWWEGDNIRIFVNGVQVADLGSGDFSVDVTLNAGWNRILVKCRDEWEGWHFRLRITDLNGNPIPGLRYSLSKPGANPPATSIRVYSGNNQRGRPLFQLAVPLVAQVVDVAGMPVKDVDVSFAIVSTPAGASGQALSITSARTDDQGLVSTYLTLGDKFGTYEVQASASVGSVTFSAQAGYEHFIFTDRYWRVSTTEQTGWTGVDFDDSTWQQATEHPDIWGGSMGQLVSQGAKPIWVARWQDNQTIYLRRSFETTEAGQLSISIEVDNAYEVYLDGNKIGEEGERWDWNNWYATYTAQIAAGKHTVAVKATNTGGPAGVAAVVHFIPLTLQWSFTTGEKIHWSSPVYGDIDGDGKLEVVVGSLDSKVYALNGEDGSKLWEFATGNTVSSSPALGDIDGDGKLEVVVGSDDGKVYALNGEDGSKLWEFTTGGSVHNSAALGDIDGDGKLEVIVGSVDGKVYALNGEDGSKLWEFVTAVASYISCPALGDIDGDGKLEVVVGSSNYKVYAINGEDGSRLWEFPTGEGILSSPALGDIDGDGKLEVVVGSSDYKVYAINGENGSKLWEFETGNWVDSSPALGDIDGDGKLEVVVGSGDYKVYAINGENGSKLWEFATGHYVVSSPALGDIDGDGKLEVVVGSGDYKVYAINGEDGSKLWEFPTGGAVLSSPALGDIDGDGKLEVVVGSYDNKVYCLDLGEGSYNPNLLPWPMFHHDPNRTGLYEPPPTRLRLVKERHKDLGWSFTVIAMTQDRQRAEVVLGVATSLDEAKRMSEVFPPNRQIASLQLLAIQASERGEAKTYRSLYRHGLSKQEWQLVLICPHENGEVVLTWGDLSQVPKQYRLYLIDELTGKRIYMRTSSSYKVEQGTRDRGQGLERRFLVIADPTPSGKLQVFVNEVVPMRGGGWLIGYTVTKPAKVLGEVRTLTGRLVKQLPTSEQVKAGRGNLVWDGRSADGSLLPKGVYLVKLVAMTDEGEQVQAVRTIFVR